MPIMGSAIMSEIPWAMIAPHEAQATRNHGQTLNRLAERGGLCSSEALQILDGKPWGYYRPCEENDRALINRVREWRTAQREASHG